MIQTIKASEARTNFGKVLKRVYRSEERPVVKKGGLTAAAIISIDDFEKLSRLEKLEHFDKFSKAFGSEVKRRDINEDQLRKDLEKTKEKKNRCCNKILYVDRCFILYNNIGMILLSEKAAIFTSGIWFYKRLSDPLGEI